MRGDEIKNMRNSLGLTQEALARRLGVSVKTVNCWEREAHKPSYLAIEKIKSLKDEK